MNILPKSWRRQPTLLLTAGTAVPTFERSAMHCGARLAFRPINDVLGIEDADGARATAWLETDAGQQFIGLLDDYAMHQLALRRAALRETAIAAKAAA